MTQKLGDRISEAQQRLNSMRESVEAARGEIEDLREQINGLKAKRLEVENAPLPFDEVWPHLEAEIDQRAEKRTSFFKTFASPNNRDEQGLLRTTPYDAFRSAAPNGRPLDPWVWVLGDTVREELKAALEAHYEAYPPGLPSEERAEELEKLDAQIFDLEIQEERLISAANTFGVEIPRRGNADPQAILAAEEPQT